MKITGIDDEKHLHLLETQMVGISVFDEIILQKTEKKKVQITVSGKYGAGVPNNEKNIIYQVCKYIFQKKGFSFGVDIQLKKNIPHKMGIGGSSGNAAGVIKIFEKIYEEKFNPQDFRQFGNDIPFFLEKKLHQKMVEYGNLPSMNFSPSPLPSFGVLIIPKNIFVSTVWAYQKLAQYRKKNISFQNETNDFEKIIFEYFPDLKNIKEFFLEHNAKISALTGSGSGVFALFSSDKERKKTIGKFEKINTIRNEYIKFETIEQFPNFKENL